MSFPSRNENHSLQEKVRLSNPLQRMRGERRVALLIFNVLLLMAALMQLLGHAIQEKHTVTSVEPPPMHMESHE